MSGYTTMTVDTAYLPEETGQHLFVFYNPNDTTNCMNSPYYKFTHSNITANGTVMPFPTGETNEYKLGLGLIKYYFTIPNVPKIYAEAISYVRRGGKVCGQHPISVAKF